MRHWVRCAVALGIVALAVSPALAQGQGRGQRGQGMGGTNFGTYLSAPAVQTELKLSADDAKKVVDEFANLDRGLPADERAAKTKKILTDGLKPEQLKRLHQIVWQRTGISAAINDPTVMAAFKLDDAQKEKVKTIREETQKKIADLVGQAPGGQRGQGQQGQRGQRAQRGQGAQGGQAGTQILEIRTKANEKVLAVLTDDQKKTWKELQGDEFKGEIPAAQRRRGGN